ncbi:hypothetical protein G9A89_017356 [Geosiphon pyriformis]|nr:hypothetical protein G9A89_017356 [Geosiphon pyriformis]
MTEKSEQEVCDPQPTICISPRIKPRPTPKITYGRRRNKLENEETVTCGKKNFEQEHVHDHQDNTRSSNIFYESTSSNDTENHVASLNLPIPQNLRINGESRDLRKQLPSPFENRVIPRQLAPLCSFQSRSNIAHNITNLVGRSRQQQQKRKRQDHDIPKHSIADFFIKLGNIERYPQPIVLIEEREDIIQNIKQESSKKPHIMEEYPKTPYSKYQYVGFSKLNTPPETPKKSKKLDFKNYEQLFLELGQKNFGPSTCPDCDMSYNIGTEDDKVHAKYHRGVVSGIEYPGYKNEVIVQESLNRSRVVMFPYSRTTAFEKKKINEILEVITTELNSVELTEQKLNFCKIFLYITERKRVVGCVVAEHISHAYKVINTEHDADGLQAEIGFLDAGSAIFCSKKSVHSVCGIARIWVSRKHRRQGIATKLLDIIRNTFIFGCTLKPGSIAFSQPTSDGKALATHYTGTSEFLVYTEN